MNNIIATFCMYFTQNPSLGTVPCSTILNASYTQSSMEKEVNTVTKIYQDKGNVIYNDNKNLINTGIVIGGAYDTIQKQELKIQFPLKPLDFNIDLKENQQNSYSVNWRYGF
jgi:hypothetical protein